MTASNDKLFECIKKICEIDSLPCPDQTMMLSVLASDKELGPKTASTLLRRIGYSVDLQSTSEDDLLAITRSDILIIDNEPVVVHSVLKDKVLRIIRVGADDYESIKVGDLVKEKKCFRMGLERELGSPKALFEVTNQDNWFYSSTKKIAYTYPHIFVASIIINLFLFVVPLYIMNVYDRAVPTGAEDTLIAFSIGAVVLLTFDFILRALRGSLMNRITVQLDSEMSRGLYEQVLNLKISSKQLTAGGYIEIAREIREMRQFFANATLTTLVDMPFTLLFIFGVYFVAGNLVYVLLVAILLVLIVNLILQPMVNKSQRSFVKYNSIIQSLTLEAYTGIETVKSLAAESIFEKKFLSAGSTVQYADRYRLLTNVINNLNLFIKNIAVVLLVYFGSQMIFSLQLTLGQLVAAVMIGSRAMMVDHVSNVVSRISRMKDALENLSVFMNLPKEYDGTKTFITKSNLSGQITIKDVAFQYDGAKHPALNGINLDISANEHIALVGSVGSGKSTLVKCIINLLEASKGQIQFDGLDNTEIDPVSLRRQVHYMSSENYIFKGSVIENVRIVNPQADIEQVVKVMNEVGIMRFVKDHPMGVDMPLTDGGMNLSTGQRQSIAIARAMLSPAKVLLLDEPTSFCDLEMSAVFMQRLVSACKDKTIIFITHRLSLCQFMHRVVQMSKGEIVKDGSPKKVVPALIQEAKQLTGNDKSGDQYE
tara:strand:+ start:10119 stop:12248 length:2130 start_codon:yes stop_codon:yes gene_type:complete